MGNEATLVIRDAMSSALTNPAVHDKLTAADAKLIRLILMKDEAKWTAEEHAQVLKTFCWDAQNC
jgi:hypothetical protein